MSGGTMNISGGTMPAGGKSASMDYNNPTNQYNSNQPGQYNAGQSSGGGLFSTLAQDANMAAGNYVGNMFGGPTPGNPADFVKGTALDLTGKAINQALNPSLQNTNPTAGLNQTIQQSNPMVGNDSGTGKGYGGAFSPQSGGPGTGKVMSSMYGASTPTSMDYYNSFNNSIFGTPQQTYGQRPIGIGSPGNPAYGIDDGENFGRQMSGQITANTGAQGLQNMQQTMNRPSWFKQPPAIAKPIPPKPVLRQGPSRRPMRMR